MTTCIGAPTTNRAQPHRNTHNAETTTIVQTLLLMLTQHAEGGGRQRALPILVAAQTNVAVDNILQRLLAELGRPGVHRSLDALLRAGGGRCGAGDGGAAGGSCAAIPPEKLPRLGELSSIRKELQRHSVEAMVPRVHGGALDSRYLRRLLGEALVVFVTCAGAGSKLLRGRRFDTVIVDEASQVTEPCTLIPLMYGAQQLVLVGDHKQLGPTVSAETEAQGMSVSLFERLLKAGVEAFLLDVQYRMHPDIARFPSCQFYGGRIKTGLSRERRSLPWPLLKPVTFVDVAGGREEMGASKWNRAEAAAVSRLVQALLSRRGGLQAGDIGIITPYRAMAGALKRQLPANVEVDTVDSFQGREKPVIVFSTVRANSAGRLGFLSNQQRMNVALTRAQRALVVVGSRSTLEHGGSGRPWALWLKQGPGARRLDSPLLPQC
eukprot:jgi/Tetstr1/443040/TSEL_031099.t1